MQVATISCCLLLSYTTTSPIPDELNPNQGYVRDQIRAISRTIQHCFGGSAASVLSTSEPFGFGKFVFSLIVVVHFVF